MMLMRFHQENPVAALEFTLSLTDDEGNRRGILAKARKSASVIYWGLLLRKADAGQRAKLLKKLVDEQPSILQQLMGSGQESSGTREEELQARVEKVNQLSAEELPEYLRRLGAELARVDMNIMNITGARQLDRLLSLIDDSSRVQQLLDQIEQRNPSLLHFFWKCREKPLWEPVPNSVASLESALTKAPDQATRRRILDATEYHDSGDGIVERYLYQQMGKDFGEEAELYNNLMQQTMQAQVAIRESQLQDARQIMKVAMNTARSYLKKFPSTLILRRAYSGLLSKDADCLMAMGKLAEAHQSFLKSFEISEELVERTNRGLESLRDLSVSYNRLGNAQMAMGKLAEAHQSFLKSFEISEELVERTNRRLQSLLDLSVSYGKLGDTQVAMGKLAEAHQSFLKFFEISEELVERTNRGLESLRDLSVSYNRLGNAQVAMGKLAEAHQSFLKFFEISEELVERTNRGLESLRDLSVSYGKLGDTQIAMGKLAEAHQSFLKSFEISEELVEPYQPRTRKPARSLVIARRNGICCLEATRQQISSFLFAPSDRTHTRKITTSGQFTIAARYNYSHKALPDL